jgi:hypothetical protein
MFKDDNKHNLLQNLAKNLEQSEVKDWLQSTKETLMGDR